MRKCLELANTALQGHAIVEKLERDGFLSEWEYFSALKC